MAPLLGVFSTLFLVASAVAQVRDPIMEAGLGLQLPVLALHLLGGLFGYVVPKTMGFEESIARTMAMEVSPLNEAAWQETRAANSTARQTDTAGSTPTTNHQPPTTIHHRPADVDEVERVRLPPCQAPL